MFNVFSSAVMKLSMSFSCISLILSEAVRGRREKPLVTVCLVPEICRISKSNSRIYASHRVSKALSKSVSDLLNWAAKTFALVSKTKWTSYNQDRNFLNALRIVRYSRFIASYLRSAWFHILFLYLKGQRQFFTICIRIASHFFKLAFAVTMISLAFSE
jgi:hypothetical protein